MHSPSEFYYPGETNDPNVMFQGEHNTEQNNIKTAKKQCFLVFSTKSEQIAIQQSHIINPLLASFARSVRESIAFAFYRTDLAPSSLGLYTKTLRQKYFPVQTSHSVDKSLLLNNDSVLAFRFLTMIFTFQYIKESKFSGRKNLLSNMLLRSCLIKLISRSKQLLQDALSSWTAQVSNNQWCYI